ncbi:MAG TPA: nucleotide pyrophosphohydrolase [Gammaproteobacteria bacterium]|nr:nucleotide pyrophosphohydrolase [Gammaproteobacteria bacterium]
MDIEALKGDLRTFAEERDWDQFHSPKNLSMALTVEAAELLEHFQWLTEAQSRSLPQEVKSQVAEEIADIHIYLVRLIDKLGIDLDSAVQAKLELNRRKYPADRVRGKAAKYTAYRDDSSS